jgi:hypothetical protein
MQPLPFKEMGGSVGEECVTKLLARQPATAALWARILISLKIETGTRK